MLGLTDSFFEKYGKDFINQLKNKRAITIENVNEKYYELFSLIPDNYVINLHNSELVKYFPNNIVTVYGSLVYIPEKEIFSYQKEFNKHQVKLLPKTLKEIYLPYGVLDEVDLSEFKNLEVLDIEFIGHIISLPSSLKKLDVNETGIFDFKVLPLGIEKLNVGINEIKNIDYLQNLTNLKKLNISCYDDVFDEKIIFPENIEKLSLFFENYDKPISYPKNLKFLCINQLDISNLPQLETFIGNGDFDQDISNLPNSIEVLVLNNHYSLPITKYPNKLKRLEFENNSIYCWPLINLPKTLKKLKLGKFFNQKIDNLQNISELWLSEGFNQPLDFLPNTLRKLTILNKNYSYDLYNLPPSLERLIIPKSIKTNFEKVEYMK